MKKDDEVVVEDIKPLVPTALVKVQCSCGHWFICQSSEAFMAARADHIEAVHSTTPKVVDLVLMDALMEETPPPEAYEPVDHDDVRDE
jgi:hypothetical protein